MAQILQKYKCIFLQSQLFIVTHKQVLYRHLYPSIVLSYLHWYRLGHHWCRVVFWVKEMLFSRVLCQEPWMTAPVCTLGNFFFCVGSFKPVGFWLGQRQPHPTSRPAAPPKASTSARPHCRCTQETQADIHK